MTKLNHIKQLDGIRGVAALMVMVFHFFLNRPTNGNGLFDTLQKLTLFGQTGVSLFFVLSGFLITRILISNKTKEHFFRNFYAKRLLRISPLYYLYLILIFILIPILSNKPITPLTDQLVYYTYLQNVWMTFKLGANGPGHYWSLAVEEHFYLIWPVLVYFTNIKNLHKILLGFIVFSIILRAILSFYNYEVFYFTFTRLDDISLGALLAVWSLKKGGTIDFFKSPKVFLYIVPLVIITLILFVRYSGSVNPYLQVFKFSLIGMFYFFFIGYAINNSNWFIKIFTNKFLLFMGKISYGLYVYHVLCFSYANQLFKTNSLFLDMFIQFSLAILVSTVSFWGFEKWFLKLKVKYD